MLLNPDTDVAASVQTTGFFYAELEDPANAAPSWLPQVFQFLLSSKRVDIKGFTKGFPLMREWVGERRVRDLSRYSVTIGVRNWELTAGLDADDLLYEEFGDLASEIKGIARAVPLHFTQYLVDLLTGGFATPSYDGQYFFDTDHPNGTGAVYSNTTAAAFSAAAWQAAQLAAATIVNDDNGKPLGIDYNWIFYAPGAQTAVDAVFGTQFLAGGASNIYYNRIPPERRVVLKQLGSSAKWFLFDLSHISKPFILKLVKGLNFQSFDKDSDWVKFSTNKIVVGIDTKDEAQYMLPELAYGSSVA